MRGYLFIAFAACQVAAGADAAAVCATPQEMKVLQAAVLQQQLSSAAQSCHFRSDYQSFVNLFNKSIVKSDQSLRAFFRQQKNSEGYEAYKSRIAGAVAMHSLHDPRFCQSAKSVFDMALGRSNVASGVAPEAPALIQTGYEGCRPVPPKPVLTVKLLSRPVVAVNTAPPANAKPSSAALASAKPQVAPVPKPVPRATHIAALHQPPAPPERRASVDQVIDKVLLTRRTPALRLGGTPNPAASPPERTAPRSIAPKAVQITTQPASRLASAQQPVWRDLDAEPERPNIPNAYKPGSYWVVNGRLVRNDDLPAPDSGDSGDDDGSGN